MPDREKIFDAIRNCITEPKCRDCPWDDCERFDCKRVDVPVSLLLDALKLLKEQEAKIEQFNGYINGFSQDAVPVIRCKDCKKWHTNYLPNCGRHGCDVIGDFTKPDDFCSFAESREGR